MEHATAHRLAQEIRQSEEYQTYHALKEEVMADETTAALLKEYKKLQLRLQMAAVSGTQPDNDDMQRFQGCCSASWRSASTCWRKCACSRKWRAFCASSPTLRTLTWGWDNNAEFGMRNHMISKFQIFQGGQAC